MKKENDSATNPEPGNSQAREISNVEYLMRLNIFRTGEHVFAIFPPCPMLYSFDREGRPVEAYNQFVVTEMMDTQSESGQFRSRKRTRGHGC